MKEKIIKAIKNPYRIISRMTHYHSRIISDVALIKIRYRAAMNRRLNLDNPQTFNEKLQWLKLYDRNPEYTQMVDKYAVREYIAEKIGEEYLIPHLGVWDSFGDIDFDALPDRFVLKTTHDSGGVVLCRNKASFDRKHAEKKLSKALRTNFYYRFREWPYKDVKPRIIAEEYLTDESEVDLKDYKFMCFGGKTYCVFVCSNRSTSGLNITSYDMNWEVMPFGRNYPKTQSKTAIEKPKNFDKMVEIAEILSEDKAFVRVDFYEINSKAYFGELTFYPAAGFSSFHPNEWDKKLGDLINLDLAYSKRKQG